MRSLDQFAQEKLAALEAKNERRILSLTERQGTDLTVIRNGARMISFSCNDYLGFAKRPEIIAAAQEALSRYGAGAGASRLITGNHPLYDALEERLAQIKGAPSAMVFGSGYLANLGIVPALLGRGDLVLADELAHACLMSGARLSQAAQYIFPHNDLNALEDLLKAHRGKARRCMILTDGVFSMDGDLAPLPQMLALAQAHDAWLMSDDAHGLGVIGAGRGSSFAFGPQKIDVPLQMGTLSKAIGNYGGYLAASTPVIELLKNRARSFFFSTGLPPATVAGALAALDFIQANPQWVARPLAHAQNFTAALGLPLAQSAVVPFIIGESADALEASQKLAAQGFLVTAIRPPTVPKGTARLRFAFSAAHEEEDVARLIEAMRPLLRA